MEEKKVNIYLCLHSIDEQNASRTTKIIKKQIRN